MLRVGDQRGAHAQDDHGVHLHVGVLVGDAVGEHGYEGVLLLLGVEELDDPLAHQVVEGDAALGQVLQVLLDDEQVAVLHHQEGPAQAALVAVDDDLVHPLVEGDVDLVGQQALAAALAHLLQELARVAVQAHQVAVEVYSGLPLLLARHLLDAQVAEHPPDLGLVVALADVHDEGAVLDQTAVLALGGLVGAQAPPLGRVQVAGLEVGLGAGQGRGDAAQVAQG